MFCKKCQPKIKLLLKKIDNVLIENLDVAIDVVNTIKKAINSPIALTIIDVTPTNLDNKITALLSKNLQIAAISLGLVKTARENPDEFLKQLQDALKELPHPTKEALLFKLAALITKLLDKGRFENHIYDAATQLHYSLKK